MCKYNYEYLFWTYTNQKRRRLFDKYWFTNVIYCTLNDKWWKYTTIHKKRICNNIMFLAIYKNAHSHMTHHQRKLYLEPRYTRYTKTQFLIYRDTHTHAVCEYTHTYTPTHNHVLTHSFDLNLVNEINHVSFSKRHYHHKLIQDY